MALINLDHEWLFSVTVSLGSGYLLVLVPRDVGYIKIMQILSQGHPCVRNESRFTERR